jgi:hypothetical protein
MIFLGCRLSAVGCRLSGRESPSMGGAMTRAIRVFLLLQAAAFAAAASVHFGVVMHGFEHLKAGIAESVIGTVLLIALIVTWLMPAKTRTIGLGAQGFALLGTLVGVFTIIIGVGPRTAPDVVYHVAMICVLVAGLIVARKTK